MKKIIEGLETLEPEYKEPAPTVQHPATTAKDKKDNTFLILLLLAILAMVIYFYIQNQQNSTNGK